jgi:hypothetical protein
VLGAHVSEVEYSLLVYGKGKDPTATVGEALDDGLQHGTSGVSGRCKSRGQTRNQGPVAASPWFLDFKAPPWWTWEALRRHRERLLHGACPDVTVRPSGWAVISQSAECAMH